MTRGRQPNTNRNINWVTDEDGNVLGYMKDAKTLVTIAELSLEQSARPDITGVVASTESGDLVMPNGRIKPLPQSQNGLTVFNGKLYINGNYCREIGLNAFSLVTDALAGSNTYTSILDSASANKIKVVRFFSQPFSAQTVIDQMFNGSMVVPLQYSDVANNYWQVTDAVFDYAASLGILLVPCIISQKSAIAQAFGETAPTAVVDVKSRVRQFMRHFIRLYVTRYKNHPALGAWNPMNESRLVSATYLSDAQSIEMLTDCARVVRRIDYNHAIFSGNLDFVYDGLPTRTNFDTLVSQAFSANPSPVDTVDNHIYSDRAWISIDPANTLDSLTNPAFTYAEEWLLRNRQQAESNSKPYVLTEFGVKARIGGVGQEIPGETQKFSQIINAIEGSGVQLSLVWNFMNNTVAGQDVWDIREGTPRGDAYLSIIKNANERMRNAQVVAAPSPILGFGALQRPSACATFSGADNVNITYNGDAIYTGNQYSVILRVRKNSTPSSFARVVGAQNSAGTEGWNILYDTSGGELALSLRQSSGAETVNTFGKMPNLPVGEWHTVGFTWDASNRIDMYLDGLWFEKITSAYTYQQKSSGVGFRIGTSHSGFNGAAVSVSGVIMIPRILTATEHQDYHVFGAIPEGAAYIPLEQNGNVFGAITQSPASTSGSVTFQAS